MQTQQATRAIFIGFPSNQAGWLFYTEEKIGTMHIHVSYDATFDENFDSTLVFDTHPFQGSIAIRCTPTSNPSQLETFHEQEPSQSTGSITDFNDNALPQQTKEGSKESVTDQHENATGETKMIMKSMSSSKLPMKLKWKNPRTLRRADTQPGFDNTIQSTMMHFLRLKNKPCLLEKLSTMTLVTSECIHPWNLSCTMLSQVLKQHW
jgi:hypothetical protein